MPDEIEADDNISPLMEEINWESEYFSNLPNRATVNQLHAEWMEFYRKDPEAASRAVDVMLSTFKAFEEEDEAYKTPAMKVDEMEAARILANWGYYDPPIYEEEIKADAERYGISEREAEADLRDERRKRRES